MSRGKPAPRCTCRFARAPFAQEKKLAGGIHRPLLRTCRGLDPGQGTGESGGECLHMASSCIGIGQSGERADSPGK
jgi:hypothetical protein